MAKEDKTVVVLEAGSVAEALVAKADVIIKRISEVEDNPETNSITEVAATIGKSLSTTTVVRIISTKAATNQVTVVA